MLTKKLDGVVSIVAESVPILRARVLSVLNVLTLSRCDDALAPCQTIVFR
jgi:hypothetical protein